MGSIPTGGTKIPIVFAIGIFLSIFPYIIGNGIIILFFYYLIPNTGSAVTSSFIGTLITGIGAVLFRRKK